MNLEKLFMEKKKMGSRLCYDLFTKVGRRNFYRLLYFQQLKGSKNSDLMWGDTFNQIWCWIVGHRLYNSNEGGYPPEMACKRCHHYIHDVMKNTENKII